MKYGIYGGTFDPFHEGHLSIITGALASGQVDQVLVIPSGYPPKKDARLLTPAPYRYYMVQTALKSVINCKVLPIELLSHSISYTVKTIEALHREKIIDPTDEISLIYGTDVLLEIESWYHPEILMQQAKLLLAKRLGVKGLDICAKVDELEQKYEARISFFSIDGSFASSSEFQQTGDFSLLPQSVLQFIKKHDLYPSDNPLQYLKEDTPSLLYEYDTILFKELSKGRLLHSLNVALLAIRYAVCFGIDPDKAAIAGFLHDCAKELPITKQRDYAHQLDGRILEDALLHAPAGAVYAKERYGIDDEEILSAIRFHTTGRENMQDLEKIIYLADKLEPARDYKDLSQLRQLAKEDLDGATIACLEAVKISFLRVGGQFHPDSQAALDHLLSMDNKA